MHDVILRHLVFQITGADIAMERFVKISGRRFEEGPIPPIDDRKTNWRSYMFPSFRLNLLILFVTLLLAWRTHDSDHLQVSQGNAIATPYLNNWLYSMGFLDIYWEHNALDQANGLQSYCLSQGHHRLSFLSFGPSSHLLNQRRDTDKGYTYRQVLSTAYTASSSSSYNISAISIEPCTYKPVLLTSVTSRFLQARKR